LAAPTMSYLICSMGLIVLILVMPFFFAMERDNVSEQMAIRELTEISDYASSTLANLYYLANSTNSQELTLTKDLIYLPLTVQGSFYTLSITSIDGENASKLTAVLHERSSVVGDSWLVPGLKLLNSSSIEIRGNTVTAGCYRNDNNFYVWIGEVD
jgi:hypothetical protein